MVYRVFETETLLDLSVNVVPILIIVVFVGVLLFTDPWAFDPVAEVIALGLHVVPIVSLAILTYFAARHIG